MIRPFESMDTRRLKPNEFSEPYDIDFIISDPDAVRFTQVDDQSNVQCIIVSRKYWRDNYVSFFLIAKDYPPRLARELKKAVHDFINDCGVKRIQTDSISCPMLDRWHQFLSFECEGLRRKMLNNKDFKSWAWVKQ